jgi:hypothetical protein
MGGREGRARVPRGTPGRSRRPLPRPGPARDAGPGQQAGARPRLWGRCAQLGERLEVCWFLPPTHHEVGRRHGARKGPIRGMPLGTRTRVTDSPRAWASLCGRTHAPPRPDGSGGRGTGRSPAWRWGDPGGREAPRMTPARARLRPLLRTPGEGSGPTRAGKPSPPGRSKEASSSWSVPSNPPASGGEGREPRASASRGDPQARPPRGASRKDVRTPASRDRGGASLPRRSCTAGDVALNGASS